MPHYSCVERHIRAVILGPHETENIQPFDDEHTGRLTHLALLHVHQDRIDKLDLVLRKTFMTLYLIICSIKSS